VRNTAGRMVPLRTLMQVNTQSGPTHINRYNMFRSAELAGQYAPGFSSGQAIAAMERLSEDLPGGFGYEWTGLAYQEKLAGGQAGYIFAFSLLFVFLTLAALYESWAIPVGVLMGLPITVFGALSGIWFRGLANDVYVQVGIVMLIGLNAKLSIMIVEFAKNKRDMEGYSTFDAAAEGARLRFRAVLMTALAEVFGLMPLLLSSGAGAAARWSVGTAGDTNGDGYDDIGFAAPRGGIAAGFVFVFGGGPRIDGHYDAGVGFGGDSKFGTSLASVGDITGDGLSDLIVGGPNYFYGPDYNHDSGYVAIIKGDSTMTVTGVRDEVVRPAHMRLYPAYPNPFNSQTTIQYELRERTEVRIEVFNTVGQRLKVLYEGEEHAGEHSVVFDAGALPSGEYYYRLTTRTQDGKRQTQTGGAVLIK